MNKPYWYQRLTSTFLILLIAVSFAFAQQGGDATQVLIVGGGSRGHRHDGEFNVRVVDHDHPIMASVPVLFEISDELYYFEKDTNGSGIKVLAEGKHPKTGKTYPVVWTVNYGKGSIVCISLGHDGASHTNRAYKTILQNSMKWLDSH